MDLIKYTRRVFLGIPLLLPAYGFNLATIYILNSVFHFSPIGIISTVVVGDVAAYLGNVALTPYILAYMKKTKYLTKEELFR